MVGPKHVGKTRVGHALAEHCNGTFIDLDAVIERYTGKSPRQLYRESVQTFQRSEAETLELVLQEHTKPDTVYVLATGGGIADNKEALKIVQTKDICCVYLSVSADTAWNRIAAEPELPAFLQTESAQEQHRQLHERRATVYASIAQLIINAEQKSPMELAEYIANKLRLWL
ncbi:MAG: AAA family ATPase [Treponema sp.]|jgi:shikimate kinase|nr:AAA family ATPase [Treponema sp.]